MNLILQLMCIYVPVHICVYIYVYIQNQTSINPVKSGYISIMSISYRLFNNWQEFLSLCFNILYFSSKHRLHLFNGLFCGSAAYYFPSDNKFLFSDAFRKFCFGFVFFVVNDLL